MHNTTTLLSGVAPVPSTSRSKPWPHEALPPPPSYCSPYRLPYSSLNSAPASPPRRGSPTNPAPLTDWVLALALALALALTPGRVLRAAQGGLPSSRRG
jgi:hypothetical protein